MLFWLVFLIEGAQCLFGTGSLAGVDLSQLEKGWQFWSAKRLLAKDYSGRATFPIIPRPPPVLRSSSIRIGGVGESFLLAVRIPDFVPFARWVEEWDRFCDEIRSRSKLWW